MLGVDSDSVMRNTGEHSNECYFTTELIGSISFSASISGNFRTFQVKFQLRNGNWDVNWLVQTSGVELSAE